MLSCKDISQLASEHIDNEMPFFKRMQFRMHLMMCKNCRRFVEQFQLTIESISHLTPPKPCESETNQQVARLMEIARTPPKDAPP